MTQEQPSELFEGENSSLRKTYDETVEQSEINMCDGCQRGTLKDESGHYFLMANGRKRYDMSCTKNRYVSQPPVSEWEKEFDCFLASADWDGLKKWVKNIRNQTLEATNASINRKVTEGLKRQLEIQLKDILK